MGYFFICSSNIERHVHLGLCNVDLNHDQWICWWKIVASRPLRLSTIYFTDTCWVIWELCFSNTNPARDSEKSYYFYTDYLYCLLLYLYHAIRCILFSIHRSRCSAPCLNPNVVKQSSVIFSILCMLTAGKAKCLQSDFCKKY